MRSVVSDEPTTRELFAALMTRLSTGEGDVMQALFDDDGLLATMDAGGAALFFDQTVRTRGDVPPPEVLEAISEALFEPDTYVTHATCLADLDPALGEHAQVAAGAVRIGTTRGAWGLWLRPAGDAPGHCAEWHPEQLFAAAELGHGINGLLLLRSREQVVLAESVQRSVVLDRAPDVDGVELVARYRPASAHQLGGDWWDVFPLGGDRTAFVVGDVAGHGVVAACAMTQVRTALRAYLFEEHAPGACLDRLDLLMDGLLDVGIATAVVAVLDRATGRIEVASAGHPSPLLVTAHGGASEVDLDPRPLLGVGSGRAETTAVDLADDDVLLLFTDGLVERRGFDLGERTDRLVRLAGTRTDDEAMGEWADRLLDELGSTDDDTTMLAVRRLA